MCLGNKVVSEPSVVFYFLVLVVGWEADCMFIFCRVRYVYTVTCGSGTWVVSMERSLHTLPSPCTHR